MKISSFDLSEEINAKDTECLNQTLEQMSLDASEINDGIKFRRRLGKHQPDTARPLLIGFHSYEIRNRVISNAKKLKSKVRFKPDLTKMQKEEQKKLVEEVTKLNEDEPSDESGDYRWRLVGPPGNMQKAKVRDILKWEEEETRRKQARNARDEEEEG